jgi:hypothetical protein
MNNRRYRIVSDGTPAGTKIFDGAGQQLGAGWITKVEWSVEGGGIGTAKITVANVEVDLVGDAGEESAKCPPGVE